MKKVFNIGVNDYDKNVNINGEPIKSYQVWKSMLQRCYDEKYQNIQPTAQYVMNGCILVSLKSGLIRIIDLIWMKLE